jgi:hypothetical protein
LDAICPTRRPRASRAGTGEPSLKGGNRGTLASSGHRPEIQGKKTGRSIRCPARIRPLKKSPIRLEPLASGRAPALHCLGSVSQCLSSSLIPSVSPCEAEAPAFCRARSAPFILRLIIVSMIQIYCKEIFVKSLSERRPGAYCVGSWLTSAVAGPFRGSVRRSPVRQEACHLKAFAVARSTPLRRRGVTGRQAM